MRPARALGIVVATLLAGTTAAAHAQARGPKVAISAVFDTVTTAAANVFDSNFALREDSAWTARNRVRFRLTSDFDPLPLLSVLELEIDFVWGRVDTGVGEFPSAVDLTEIKNAYVELPVPGPRGVPPTVARLGAQPFRTTLKRGVLASGDYAGVSLEAPICGVGGPSIPCDDARVAFTYAQVEESLTGEGGVDRGDDFFVFLSLTYPVAVDRRAMRLVPRAFWGYLDAEGATAAAARCRIACAGLPLNGFDPPGTVLAAGAPRATTGHFRPGSNEFRHYFGVDGVLDLELGRWGRVQVQPTAIYMTSTVDVYGAPGVPATATCGPDAALRCPADAPRQSSRTQSWLLDVRAGWLCDGRCLDETWVGDIVRLGDALHLEGLLMWTPGDASHHNVFRKNRVYHPLTTDSDYLAGWNEILATGSVDYLTGNAHGMGDNVGLGQYGRWQLGTRLTWDVWRYADQALSFHGKSSWVWTDQKVDTDAGSPQVGGSGSYANVPCALRDADCRPDNNRRGDARYVGTEVSLGLTYTFHRSLVFDAVAAYLFAGSALDSTARDPDGMLVKRAAKDAHLVAARVRYSF